MNLNIKSFANSTNLVHRSWTPQFHPEFFATDLATLPQHQILRRVITWALSNPKLGCTVAMACPTLCPNDVTMAEMCRKHRWNNRQPCHASVPGTFTTCQSAMVAMVQLDLGFTKQLMSFATSIPPAFFWYNSLRNIECKCYQIHSCKMSFFDINANAINIFVKPVPMVLIMSDHLCIDQLTLMLDWWISQPNMTTILAAFFCMLIISEWVNLSQPPSKSYFGETNISDFDVNCSARVLYNMIHLKEIAASYDTYDLKTKYLEIWPT